MSLSYRATPATSQSSGAVASFSVNKQAGTAVGDWIFIYVFGGTSSMACTGFTALPDGAGYGGLLYRLANGTEGSSFSITGLGGNSVSAVIATVAGATSTLDPSVVGTPQLANNTTGITLPSITLSYANDWVLWFASNENGFSAVSYAITPPGGFTSRATNGAQTANPCVMLADNKSIASGATGTQAGTSSTASYWSGIMAGLTPAIPIPAVQAIRAPVPQPFSKGRAAGNPGAPVRNPSPGPVFKQKPAPVRFILPPWRPRAGRIGSSFGAPVANPIHGPPVYPLPGPVHARIPLFRLGRVEANAGTPVHVPPPGPAVYTPQGPARARIPQLAPRAGRVYSSPGGTVQNPSPGPAFRPASAQQPTRPRIPQNAPRGRITSSPGAPLRDPVGGPAVYPLQGPVRSRTAPPFSKGRIASSPGAPLRNPPAGPVFRQAVHPARAVIPQVFSKGRAAGNPGAPARNPSHGPVFRQATAPARIRPSLPPRGRTASNPGGPVQNPVRYAYYGREALTYLDYTDDIALDTLTAVPGGSYLMSIANSRAGLTIPPPDGRWVAGNDLDFLVFRPGPPSLAEVRAALERARTAHGHYAPGGCRRCLSGGQEEGP